MFPLRCRIACLMICYALVSHNKWTRQPRAKGPNMPEWPRKRRNPGRSSSSISGLTSKYATNQNRTDETTMPSLDVLNALVTQPSKSPLSSHSDGRQPFTTRPQILTLDVAFELLNPALRVVFGHRQVTTKPPMPEASVDKYRDPPAGDAYVQIARRLLPVEATPGVAGLSQHPPDQEFG